MFSTALSRQEIYGVFETWWDQAIYHLPNVAFGVATLVLAVVAAGGARRWAKRALTKASGDERAGNSWGRVVQYSVLLLGVVVALAVAGVSLSALMVAVGAVGFAIAFATQETIANFIAGLIILTTHPFARGDTVGVNGAEGKVEEISIRSTKLTTFDGLKVEVPNKQVLSNNITVYSYHPTRRFEVAVGVGYDDDIQGAVDSALAAAATVDDVLEDPSPEVFVTDLGDSSVNLNVRFWVRRADRGTMLAIKGEVAKTVKQALDEAGYDIPYPIRTLYVSEENGADPAVEPAAARPDEG
jgi:small conductance mechanosensitive channel